MNIYTGLPSTDETLKMTVLKLFTLFSKIPCTHEDANLFLYWPPHLINLLKT